MTVTVEEDECSSDEEIGSDKIEDNLLKIRDDDPSAESTDDDPRGLNWALELEAEDKAGEPVSSNVAKLVGQRFNKKLSDDKYKDKAACYQKPSNCESLVIPKVNSEIWISMSSGTRAVDAKHQEMQGALIQGLQPLIKNNGYGGSSRRREAAPESR